jgi:serine/threonine protein kinase
MPERIDDFAILRRIGQGGMGVVCEARQDSPRRRVAIKLMHPMQRTPERMRRFHRETEVLGRLQHPGIAQIFEAGTFDAGRGEQPFFAMELVEGVDVRTYCELEGLDLGARIELLAGVAEAVHYEHERGVVHRDLKPDNVLVDADGRPRVLDSGSPGRSRRRVLRPQRERRSVPPGRAWLHARVPGRQLQRQRRERALGAAPQLRAHVRFLQPRRPSRPPPLGVTGDTEP